MAIQRTTIGQGKWVRPGAVSSVQWGAGRSAKGEEAWDVFYSYFRRQVQEQVRSIKEGVPAEIFDVLAILLGSPREVLAQLAAIAPRTLSRRKRSGTLTLDEGERVYRIGKVFLAALDLFSNDKDAASRWLNMPSEAFEGRTPLEYSDTEPGAQFVLEMIGRLEHGVFS